jgi:IS30 family transposase
MKPSTAPWFVQTGGALKQELLAHLRSRRMMRRGRCASTAGQQRGQIKDAVSIRERPPEAEERAVPGHTGKGTCSPDHVTSALPPWSSAAHGL